MCMHSLQIYEDHTFCSICLLNTFLYRFFFILNVTPTCIYSFVGKLKYIVKIFLEFFVTILTDRFVSVWQSIVSIEVLLFNLLHNIVKSYFIKLFRSKQFNAFFYSSSLHTFNFRNYLSNNNLSAIFSYSISYSHLSPRLWAP